MTAKAGTPCDACLSKDHPVEYIRVQGQMVWACQYPTPCLNRARAAKIGMWAETLPGTKAA